MRSAFLIAMLLSPARAAKPGPRDWLWHIVSECLDAERPDLCERCLRPAPGRCGDVPCEDRTFVWSVENDYAAVQDRKMCGCPPEFAHGLALPRVPVAGVEDPRRPAGLWAFAWKTARARIVNEGEILLAVNGPSRRTQDQLHVHMLRLSADGRQKLAATSPERVSDLAQVWTAAERHAQRIGVDGWYGIAVARAADGPDFLVAASPGDHPETEFGRAFCRP